MPMQSVPSHSTCRSAWHSGWPSGMPAADLSSAVTGGGRGRGRGLQAGRRGLQAGRRRPEKAAGAAELSLLEGRLVLPACARTGARAAPSVGAFPQASEWALQAPGRGAAGTPVFSPGEPAETLLFWPLGCSGRSREPQGLGETGSGTRSGAGSHAASAGVKPETKSGGRAASQGLPKPPPLDGRPVSTLRPQGRRPLPDSSPG